MKKIKLYTFLPVSIFIITTILDQKVTAEENYNFNKDWQITSGIFLQGNLNTVANEFKIEKSPKQGSPNQPSSGLANNSDLAMLSLELKQYSRFSIHSKIAYYKQEQQNLSLYRNDLVTNQISLLDLYLELPVESQGIKIWIGRRTFNFEAISIFDTPNPFDQTKIQGGGIEFANFQIAAGINRQSVYTVAKNTDGSLVTDQNKNLSLFALNEYVATLFISGKLLLAEGKLFEPILAIRVYLGGKTKKSTPDNSTAATVQKGSALIMGGIFSRPLSNGIAGSTTLWFESLPTDGYLQTTNDTQLKIDGIGRVPANAPKNTIGVSDSSVFHHGKRLGMQSGIVFTYNEYGKDLPKLYIGNEQQSLVSSSTESSNINYRLSLTLQPVYLITQKLQLAFDANANYVNEKLLSDDVNSFIITPAVKYAFDTKIDTTQYLFAGVSYGLYDWKIKVLSNGSQTDRLLTAQVGAHIDW